MTRRRPTISRFLPSWLHAGTDSEDPSDEEQTTTTVVQYCERLLDGTAVELFSAGRDPIPEWIWVNTLAHATEETLLRIASRSRPVGDPHPEERAWELTFSYLARAILAHSGKVGTPLQEIQRKVLLPIELASTAHQVGPSTLVRLILAGLTDLSRSDA